MPGRHHWPAKNLSSIPETWWEQPQPMAKRHFHSTSSSFMQIRTQGNLQARTSSQAWIIASMLISKRVLSERYQVKFNGEIGTIKVIAQKASCHQHCQYFEEKDLLCLISPCSELLDCASPRTQCQCHCPSPVVWPPDPGWGLTDCSDFQCRRSASCQAMQSKWCHSRVSCAKEQQEGISPAGPGMTNMHAASSRTGQRPRTSQATLDSLLSKLMIQSWYFVYLHRYLVGAVSSVRTS